MPAVVLHDVLTAATRRLREAGFAASDAAADVAVLGRHLLHWDRGQLLARRLDLAPEGFTEALDALVTRRLDREPVAYLTGTREFYGLDFEVTPDVLIPRPETELAVEATLAALPLARRPAPRVVDVGTGSGAIAIAVAIARFHVRVTAIDRSRAALAVARRNVERHAVADRVRLVAGDLLTAVAPRGAAGVDVVVSNPPYVPDDSPDVMPDVHRHEPALALYAGRDGLDVIRRLIVDALGVVAPGGSLVMEIGAGQADAVAGLAEAAGGWLPAQFRHDLQGIARVAVVSRTAELGR
jgi:release factor glutamine methyltransferase